MFRDGDSYFGLKERTPGYRFATENYDITQMILVTRGKLKFTGSVTETMTPGNFCLLTPGSAFQLSCSDSGYRGIACEIWNSGTVKIRGESTVHTAGNRMRIIGDWVEEEYRRAGGVDPVVIRDLCRTLFDLGLRIRRESEQFAGPRSEEFHAARAVELIEAHAATGRTLEEIFRSLPVSYRHLSRFFRNLTGKTPKQYRDEYRLAMAIRYLELTDMDVTAVARELGFSSPQHFAQTFKRFTGVSPSRYRGLKQEQS